MEYNYDEIRESQVLEVAKKMSIAATTAPKGRGISNITIKILTGKEIEEVSNKMIEMCEKENASPVFERDANNILQADALFLIGTKISSLGLTYCGLCGFKSCADKSKIENAPCAFNTGDLGIAIGSAVSIATDNRVDNRIMYTVGMAVRRMNLLGDDVKVIYGIPLSGTGKNPFFDRK